MGTIRSTFPSMEAIGVLGDGGHISIFVTLWRERRINQWSFIAISVFSFILYVELNYIRWHLILNYSINLICFNYPIQFRPFTQSKIYLFISTQFYFIVMYKQGSSNISCNIKFLSFGTKHVMVKVRNLTWYIVVIVSSSLISLSHGNRQVIDLALMFGWQHMRG